MGDLGNIARCGKLAKAGNFLGFSVDKALGIDTGLIEEDDDDDKTVWLMIGGFAIGTVLGIAFEKYILGLAFAIVGQGLGAHPESVR